MGNNNSTNTPMNSVPEDRVRPPVPFNIDVAHSPDSKSLSPRVQMSNVPCVFRWEGTQKKTRKKKKSWSKRPEAVGRWRRPGVCERGLGQLHQPKTAYQERLCTH